MRGGGGRGGDLLQPFFIDINAVYKKSEKYSDERRDAEISSFKDSGF